MTEVVIDPEVFNEIYLPYLDDYTRVQIFFGGSSSGKSVFLAQRCVYDLMRGGRNYLICRQVARTIRTSVFAQVCRVISEWGVGRLFSINKSDYVIACRNGYQIVFVGLDDPEKIKSIVPAVGSWTDVWIEEATETERDAVKQLIKRQRGSSGKRLVMSFNPILQTHWIYSDYFSQISLTDTQTSYKTAGLAILKTWYVHNRFLTDEDRSDLENETDPYYRSVYTFGNWGVLGHLIFTNWRVEDLSAMREQFVNTRNGLDFGFSSDPAALSRSHYDRMRQVIYIFDELYETGLTNPELADELRPMVGKELVICDSAEPKSIAELQDCGIQAYPAKKGADSVNFGIQWLQQQTIIIDAGCVNTKNEFMQYHWKVDAAGHAIRRPVDKFNHLIDATRYAYEDDMEGSSWLTH